MKDYKGIKIIDALTPGQLDAVRDLVRAFIKWHLDRHTEDVELIKEYFDAAAIETELAGLPGKYSKPEGSLILALYNQQPAGCVALRKIDGQSCEMKRMFVYDRFKGQGVGSVLTASILEEAKKAGYKTMKLDTSCRQTEAQRLYEKAGFKRVEPYYELPQKLKDWLVFYELQL